MPESCCIAWAPVRRVSEEHNKGSTKALTDGEEIPPSDLEWAALEALRELPRPISLLQRDGLVDGRLELHHVDIVTREVLAADVGDDVVRFFMAFNLAQPARRFGQEPDPEDLEKDDDDLEGDDEPPLQATTDVRHADVEVVGDHDTKSDEVSLDGDMAAAVLGRNELGNPERCCRSVETVAPTADDATDDHLRHSE